MFKVLRPLKDAYITNRIINGTSRVNANVGAAASLDLFKLYGTTTTTVGSSSVPNTELSRLLIQFDLAPLRAAVAAGQVDPTNSTFSCRLHLYDVYGGQPTPNNFNVTVTALSASFDAGLGRDVVYYSDFDVCNYLSSSRVGGAWYMSGCSMGGSAQQQCDYITASAVINGGASLVSSQFFVTGEEDLDVDVTTIVSATLAGLLPDAGFRITLDPVLETDAHTYFVKRFAGHSAFNEDVRPKLFIRFDDSIQDDADNLYLDSPSTLFLYNYARSAPANLVTGSTVATGTNCLLLQLVTPISGGLYSLYFTGSQHSSGINQSTGIYSASVILSSNDPKLIPSLRTSGSITFTPIWGSLDGTVSYVTGSDIIALPPQRGPESLSPKIFTVTVDGLQQSYVSSEQTILRVNIFDHTSPFIAVVKVPVELPGIVVRDAHFQVRDVVTGHAAIPFDTITNSTRVSNDSTGMYFKLDTSDLTNGHSYVIDVLIVTANNRQLYKTASPTFRVDAAS